MCSRPAGRLQRPCTGPENDPQASGTVVVLAPRVRSVPSACTSVPSPTPATTCAIGILLFLIILLLTAINNKLVRVEK